MITPEVGAVIGGLRIDAVAGRGGMGVVYKAHQLALDRTVAMKIVNPELADDPEFRERFRREARIAASLDHPHVVPIYHSGEDGGNVYLTMRFVDGTDLASMIASRGRVEPRDAVEIVAQIADALDAAHARGLVHRDVKPANILLTRPGGRWHTYLTDFGISKDGRDAGMTRSGFVVGSLSYISPEQLQGDDVDGRADQYSLACVLFQALTGEVPFARDSTAARMFAHMSTPAPALSEVSPVLRGPLEPVLARALAKRPADRYPTAGEFGRAALAAVAQMDDQRATPPPFPPSGFPPHTPYGGSHPGLPQTFGYQGPSGPQQFGAQEFGAQHFGPPQGVPQLGPQGVGAPGQHFFVPPGPSGPHQKQPARRGLLYAGIALLVVAALVVGAIFLIPALTRDDGPVALPPTGRIDGAPVDVGVGADALTEGGGFLWTGNRDEASLSKIDPVTRAVQKIAVPGVPAAVVYGQGRVWVWNYSSTILPVDAASGTVGTYVDVGGDISGIAVGSTSVWAALPGRNAVVRLDLATAQVAGSPIAVGSRPESIAVGNGKVYVLNKADRTISTLDEVSGTALGPPVSVPEGSSQVTVESGRVYIGGTKGFALVADGPSGLQQVAPEQMIDPDCACGFYGGPAWVWMFDDDAGTLRRFSPDLRTQLGAPLAGFGSGVANAVPLNGTLWVLNRAQSKLYPVVVDVPL